MSLTVCFFSCHCPLTGQGRDKTIREKWGVLPCQTGLCCLTEWCKSQERIERNTKPLACKNSSKCILSVNYLVCLKFSFKISFILFLILTVVAKNLRYATIMQKHDLRWYSSYLRSRFSGTDLHGLLIDTASNKSVTQSPGYTLLVLRDQFLRPAMCLKVLKPR